MRLHQLKNIAWRLEIIINMLFLLNFILLSTSRPYLKPRSRKYKVQSRKFSVNVNISNISDSKRIFVLFVYRL